MFLFFLTRGANHKSSWDEIILFLWPFNVLQISLGFEKDTQEFVTYILVSNIRIFDPNLTKATCTCLLYLHYL